MILPEGFEERMRRILKGEYEAFQEALLSEKSQALRVNGAKKRTGSKDFLRSRFSLSEVPWCSDGFLYREEERPGKSALHEAGAYYIQEPSAMSAAELLFADRPDYAADGGRPLKILDLCAAPGGKSTQIASHMKGKGLLWSNEIHPARAKILSQNIERMGIESAVVSCESPDALAGKLPGFFDRILVDAPCSGEGMFRKSEEALNGWSLENIALCAKRQREILRAADRLLAPGGLLVYSTCTFAPEEDEQTIEWLLDSYTLLDYRNTKVPGREETFGMCFQPGLPEQSLSGSEELVKCFRLFPHKLTGEGHFAAVLKKAGEQREASKEGRPANKPGKKALLAYLSSEIAPEKSLEDLREAGFLSFGDQWYAIPGEAPSLDGLRILRPGLHLAEKKGNLFVPAHALALSLGEKDVYRSVSLSETDPRSSAFLRGEGFPFEGEKGWYLICVEGYSAGWGKCDGRQMKNHIPKGLRKETYFQDR